MNGETIKQFLVGLGFKVDDAGMKKFEGGIKSATVAVAAIGTAAVAATGALVHFVSGVAKDLDVVSDLAIRTGATAQEIMELGYAASLTDGSVEAVARSMDELSRVTGEAAMGMGEGLKVFQTLGIQLKDENETLKSTGALMREIGQSIKDLDRAQQIAILRKLGIDPTMLGALTSDIGALTDEFNKMFDDLGVDINQSAQLSSDFQDSMGRLTFIFDSLKKAIALKFMPQLKLGIDTLRQMIVDMLPRIMKAIDPFIKALMRVGEASARVFARLASWIGIVLGWLGRLNDATGGWAANILAAVAAWKYLNLAFLASPLGMLISLGAAVALLIDDFLTWQEGGETLLDWGGKWGVWLVGATAALGTLFTSIVAVKAATAAYAAMTTTITALQKAWAIGTQIVTFAQWALNVALAANPIGAVIVAIVALIAAGALLVAKWDSVKAWFSGFFDWILSKFEVVGNAVSGIVGFFGGGGGSAASPTPQAAQAMTGGNQNVNQNTNITVQGAGDPAATARAVGREQNRVNGDMARNLAGAAR